ncbi:concanavalin A-like lectin/glucanase domain-containing protein [Massariosphaeria phaeospora]|uniref:Concanavalin A-like lectin/glucanase domain-containing protein n=1 Tax=Massariosphaeria phaeospora TaxID=100035 RepID=A0A7C8M8I8_9PLEO|nr:concanavalin A-like lectin/glucanase domain-containing protein [Massariosphaeria phaeospora]
MGQQPGYPGQQQQQQQQYTGSPFPQHQSQSPYGPPSDQPASPYGAPPNQPSSPYGAPPNQTPSPYGAPPNQQAQNQQWGPPQQQWGPPQQQWQQPPQQQVFTPPVPQHSKPQSPNAPPVPQNRPISNPPPPQNIPPPHAEKVYWKPSFDASTPVSQNFRHEQGDHGWGNEEKQNYTDNPANSFHHDNRLIVRALVQDGTYTSARLTSHQTLSRPRGYLTATVLPPCAEGIWPAYWMLPKDPFQWPGDGEVDIFESWNGDCINHSCLHWGHYNGEDHNKHQVVTNHLHDMMHQPHTFGFAWTEEEGIPGWRGRMLWYIDGRPVMKANIPAGTRRLEEFRILINVAMGGTVCAGMLPREGYYDLVVSDLKMCEEPTGGWGEFEKAWGSTPEGKPM